MSEQQSLFGRKLHADLEIEDELWEAAKDLRGTVAPAEYKHYVLPLLFLRYLSLRYEERREQLEEKVEEPDSFYTTADLEDPTEYRNEGAFLIPEKARWSYLVEHTQDDDIKVKVDRAMELQATNPRSQLSLVTSVMVATSIIGSLAWLCTKMLGHFYLQDLIHDFLQEHLGSPVAELWLHGGSPRRK